MPNYLNKDMFLGSRKNLNSQTELNYVIKIKDFSTLTAAKANIAINAIKYLIRG